MRKAAPIILIMLLLPALRAFADSVIDGPTQSSSGNYTLSWQTNCDGGFQWTQLLENSQVVTSSVMCPATYNATGQPDGVYTYQLQGCFTNQFTGTICLDVGDPHAVTVNSGGSVPPPAGDGLVRRGDAYSNGLTDLYVAPENGTPFLLRQISGQSFQLVTGLSSGQMSSYASWPQSAAFLVASDLDIDGHDDLMIRDVDAVIPNAHEWVVFRNAAGTASRIMPLNFDRESFLGQLFAWSWDRNFFVDVAIDEGWFDETTQVGWYTFSWLVANQVIVNGQVLTGDPFDPGVAPAVCGLAYCYYDAAVGWLVYLQITFQEPDLSNFHDEAIAVLQQIQQVEQGNGTMRSVVDILETVFGPISCNGVDPASVIIWDNSRPTSYFEDAECIWNVLAGYTNALHEDPAENLLLELRTRPVRWPIQTFQHLSIYDPSESVTDKRWVSAFPENGAQQAFLDNGGFLQSEEEDNTDRPAVTVTAAKLSLGSTGLAQQWAHVLSARDNFDNNSRPYCITPDISLPFFPDCSGFNSNGWAIGLVNFVSFSIAPVTFRHVRIATGTSVMTFPLEFDATDSVSFPGITVPIPGSDFQ